MRRVFCGAALLAAAALGVGACGGGGGDNGKQAAQGSSSHTPVTITLWHGFTEREAGVVAKAVAAFHKTHPWITVKSVGGVNDDKIIAAIRGGNAPDVALSNSTDNTGSFCSTGAWSDLKP